MSKIDSFLDMVDTKMANVPVMDDNGNLTQPPPAVLKKSPVFQNTQAPVSSGIYDSFFESVEKVEGKKPKAKETKDDSARIKAKSVLTEALEILDKENSRYWTNDASLIEASEKIKNVLSKIVNKI